MSWIPTYSGLRFVFEDPAAYRFVLEDIAHALSNLCRFGGHTQHFYSVAQHSVIVSKLVDPANAMEGLMHDAAEAYVGDVVTPLKLMLSTFAAIEDPILEKIYEFANVQPTEESHVDVKRADLIALATERRDLFRIGVRLQELNLPAPMTDQIVPWSPTVAEDQFIARYSVLAAEQLSHPHV